jgi:predicted CopG family antitoxin
MAKRKKSSAKRVAYQLLKRNAPENDSAYELLRELVTKHHEDLNHQRIALAWNLAWKPDVDGRVTLGKCKRLTDLDREFAAFDFVIILRREWWQHRDVTDAQRRALLDHELCHATVRLDSRTGEPIEDERGRKVYRTRKHDIEEFSEVVRRHGTYKRDLEVFAADLLAGQQRSLLEQQPGSDGKKRRPSGEAALPTTSTAH